MPRRNEAKTTSNVPERVGPYEVLLPIAAGGMATVYLAHARSSGNFTRQVAIKVTHAHLRTADDFAIEMIEEAKLAGRIRHPNVVGVNDAGDDPHGVYLAMEYVEGDTLSGLIRYAKRQQELVPIPVALRILVDALMGLHAAHQLKDDDGRSVGLVHRDFSPQNILVGRDGVSRLADFGVAKAAIRLGNTRTGLVKGKIRYMSPEQARSQDIDRTSDVWAAGIVAWELFAGKRLYEDMNDTGMLLQLVEHPPPSVLSIKPKTPVVIADVITRALTMDPAGRYPTAIDMADALRRAARECGGLAEPTEVGAYVEEAYGHALDKRRERAQEILRLRAEMGRLAGIPQREETTTNNRVRANAQPGSGIRPRHELLVGSPLISPLPLVPTTPVAESSDPMVDDASTVNDPLHGTRPSAPGLRLTPAAATPSVAGGPADPPASRRLVFMLAAVAAMILGGIAAFGLHRMKNEASASPVAEAKTGAGSVVDTSTEIETPPVAETPAAPPNASAATEDEPAPNAEDPAAQARSVSIASKVPFVQLQVDARTVAMEQPETQLDILLTEEERGRVVRLIAAAIDGRRTVVRLAPDENEAQLVFPRAGGGAKPDKGGAAPLASSPYER